MNKIKLALVQQKFRGSRDSMIDATLCAIKTSKLKGAQIVCLQELHTSEYFCQSEEVSFFNYANFFEQDKEIFSRAASENNVILVTSLFEKRAPGLYHNTAVTFEKDGSIAGIYRKMHIPDDPHFYEKFYFTPGDLGFEPIQTSLGKLGVLICWDQWYSEAARIMALKGAQILIYPTAIGWFDEDDEQEKNRQQKAWINIQRSHAIANGLNVVAINRVGFEEHKSKIANGIRFWGSSIAFGPQGEKLGQLDSENEGILYVEVDLARSEKVRCMWPFLRDRRIDAYGDITKRFID